MKRLDIAEISPAEPCVVPRKDYEADRKRGFCVLEYTPARTMVIHNPRNPEQTVTKQLPAVLMFRCMRCRYDVVESDYGFDPETKQKRTGLDLIQKHLDRGVHPWPYNAFESPYGNVQDVTIEGVTDYTEEK